MTQVRKRSFTKLDIIFIYVKNIIKLRMKYQSRFKPLKIGVYKKKKKKKKKHAHVTIIIDLENE